MANQGSDFNRRIARLFRRALVLGQEHNSAGFIVIYRDGQFWIYDSEHGGASPWQDFVHELGFQTLNVQSPQTLLEYIPPPTIDPAVFELPTSEEQDDLFEDCQSVKGEE